MALENAISLPLTEGANDDDIYVIEDLWEHPLCAGAPFLTSGPRIRFYAGAPLRAPDGSIIGIYCIFDNKLRPGGLKENDKEFLRDMAKTTVDHLETIRSNRQHTRSNRLVSGLAAFIDGLAAVRSPEQEAKNRLDPVADNPSNLAKADVAAEDQSPQASDQRDFAPEHGNADAPGLAPKSLWELALPSGSKPMFSRATNIIQQAGDYDGVAFFYMDSHHTKGQGQSSYKRDRDCRSSTTKTVETLSAPAVDPPLPFDAGTSSDGRVMGCTDSEDSSAAEQPSPESVCPLLSYSLASGDNGKSPAGPFRRFRQRDLDILIGSKAPRARTITLNRRGEVLPGDTSSSSSNPEPQAPLTLREGNEDVAPHSSASEARGSKIQRQLLKSLRRISSDAVAYGFLPLWDFERQRYLAYCIVWSSSSSRHMKEDGDLAYLRIFSNSIAIALSHIDAIADNRTKSTFVSSMSHEIRSPLHGILSATNFLNDSSMTRFQREMVDVITQSGTTLLDCLDHIMTFAKISSLGPMRKVSSNPKIMPASHAQEDSNGSSFSSIVDLGALFEEVIETVLMGFNVQHDFVHDDDDDHESRPPFNRSPSYKANAASLSRSRKVVNSRGRVRIVMQLPQRNWCVRTQPGAWRRIIMNLVGNAMKYTSDGCVGIRLEAPADSASSMLPISLHIDDTGKGMSKQYMDTSLFTPFSQEDDLASGTGLGLSTVKQITDALGGIIDVSSSQGVGTDVHVKVDVPTTRLCSASSESSAMFQTLVGRLQGRQVCILDDTSAEAVKGSDAEKSRRAEVDFYTALLNLLRDWFGAETSVSATWPTERVSLIIVLKPLLKYVESTTTQRLPQQPLVFVTHDALEMAALRTDARISREDAVIEIVSQPLGPHKLARTITACLDRQHHLDTNPINSHDKSRANSSSQIQLPIRRSSPTPSASPSDLSRRMSNEARPDPFVLIVDDNKVNLRVCQFPSVFVILD